MNNLTNIFLIIAAINLFTYRAEAQVIPSQTEISGTIEDSLAKKVDTVFSQYDTPSSPGCALAILKDGKVIYQRGYGMATLEYNIAISPSSIFHVASISKQFTAAAIMQLAMAKKISLADDIRKYIPEVPDFGHTITIKHLLHHTSGIKDQWDLQRLAGWRSDDVITEDDVVDMMKRQKGLNFVPGDEFSYSNTGYTLLGMAVKKITGVSLKDYADSLFFKPLGMHHTHFHNDHAEITPNRTSAYLGQKGKWKIFLPVLDNYGATGLFTTVEDLAKWDENFYSNKVGSDEFIKALESKGTLNDKTPLIYASGLVVENYKGHQTIGHPGADAGYRSNYLRFPDEHFSVIILGNVASMNTVALSKKVADIFLKDKTINEGQLEVEVKTDSTKVKSWAGLYLDRKSKSTLVFTYKAGKLVKGTDALAAIDGSTFLDKPSGSSYKFNENNIETSLEVSTTGYKKTIYQKVDKLTLPQERLQEYTGEFYSPELEARYTILVKDGALYVKAPRNKEIKLNPLVKEIFTSALTIQFYRNKTGEIAGYNLTMGRTQNINFHKVEIPL